MTDVTCSCDRCMGEGPDEPRMADEFESAAAFARAVPLTRIGPRYFEDVALYDAAGKRFHMDFIRQRDGTYGTASWVDPNERLGALGVGEAAPTPSNDFEGEARPAQPGSPATGTANVASPENAIECLACGTIRYEEDADATVAWTCGEDDCGVRQEFRRVLVSVPRDQPLGVARPDPAPEGAT